MLFLNDPETIKLFSDKNVDFYLEDDMFELEGKFFLDEDGDLMIEVLDAVGHILEMAGKYLLCGQRGTRPTAMRPDEHVFDMEINRVYYIMDDPKPEDFIEMHEKHGIIEFFFKLEDVMVNYIPEEKKWTITRDKINMLYGGKKKEYDSVAELLNDNQDVVAGAAWQALFYRAEEEEEDFTSFVGSPTPEFDKW